MLMRLALATAALVGSPTLARADGLNPAGTAAQGLCYASGSSGTRVPCVLQGQTWTRVLRPADPADSLTIAGRPLSDTIVARDGGAEVRAKSSFIGSTDVSWPNAWQPGFADDYQGGASRLTIISTNGRYGSSTAVRASDNTTLDQINVIGDNVMVVMDSLDRPRRGWGRYTHGAITANAKIEGYINDENSVANYGAAVPSDPYNINPPRSSVGLRLDSGFSDGGYHIPAAGGATPNTASVAMSIVPNGARFFTGIQFGNGALDTSLTGGVGHAMQLPASYALVWQRGVGFTNVDFRLYGDGSGSFNLDGAGPVVIGASSGGRLQLQGGPSPVISTTSGDLGLSSVGGTIYAYAKISAGQPIVFQPQSAPGEPARGYTYYDDGLNVMRTWDGTAWRNHW